MSKLDLNKKSTRKNPIQHKEFHSEYSEDSNGNIKQNRDRKDYSASASASDNTDEDNDIIEKYPSRKTANVRSQKRNTRVTSQRLTWD